MFDIDRAILMIQSLGSMSSLRIINLLYNESLPVYKICQILEIERHIILRHLKVLISSGLIYKQKTGKVTYFYLAIPVSKFHQYLIDCINLGLEEADVILKDMKKFRELL